MIDIKLVGISGAAREFSECEGPASIFVDVNTGDVWAKAGKPSQVDGAFCIVSKPLFSRQTTTEEDLQASCNSLFAVLIPNYTV